MMAHLYFVEESITKIEKKATTINKEDDYLNKSYNINFDEYSLVETIKIYKNNSLVFTFIG